MTDAVPSATSAVARDAAAPPALEAIGLKKSYGHVQAVDDFSFQLRTHEIVALVGDNGAGKSTTVAMLCGLVQPDDGGIRVGGEDVRLSDPRQAQRMGISTVFQDLALVNERDVAQNLYLGQELVKFGVFTDRKRMLAGAAQTIRSLAVNIPSVRAKVGDLSGGQRQAVAVARAVLQGGRVTLLDEPTAALGVREGRKVLDIVVKLREAGHAVLLISHNLETVFDIADRIIVMRLGRKVSDVRTTEITRREVVEMIVGAYELGRQ
jgi:ABC-type sugar transport system ATPase subunit